MALTAGTLVTNNIRLERLLSKGGMGSVWVAEHLGLRNQVAVKFISPFLLEMDPTLGARFQREASAAAKLASPHAVTMFDHGAMDDGTPYIVMELLRGKPVDVILRQQGKLRPQEVFDIVAQIAKALKEAHAKGIVHRDIKPANIFLLETDDFFVKVLDFGIAKVASGNDPTVQTATGAMLGTPAYMSPEQALGSPGVDFQADLWALSAVTYEMWTGSLPFVGNSIASVILAVMSHKYEPACKIDGRLPPAVDGFFEQAFAKDPASRFGSVRELVDALGEALQVARSAAVSARTSSELLNSPSGGGAADSAGFGTQGQTAAGVFTGYQPPVQAQQSPPQGYTAHPGWGTPPHGAPQGGPHFQHAAMAPKKNNTAVIAVVVITALVLISGAVGVATTVMSSRPSDDSEPAQPSPTPDVERAAGKGSLPSSHAMAAVPIRKDDPSWGDLLAPVTIVIYSDFQ
jgi:serine/threonine-protein kinase